MSCGDPTLDAAMKNIVEDLKGYYNLWRYLSNSPTPRYSAEQTVAEVERYLAYLARITPILQRWATAYLNQNRGAIWLQRGLNKCYKKTFLEEWKKTWPWLYDRTSFQYRDFSWDRDAAAQEKERQYARRNTKNPNYVPLPYNWWEDADDVNEWYKEEEEERNASRNILINYKAQEPCYEAMLTEIESVREQWEVWQPPKHPYEPRNEALPDPVGKTRDQYVLEWIKWHYYYHSSFPYYHDNMTDTHRYHNSIFDTTWNIANTMEEQLAYHQQQLQQVKEVLQQMEIQPTKETTS